MSALDKLTESQFHTVWTEAVGRIGYDKKMFRETLISLKEKGLITESNLVTSVGNTLPNTESKSNIPDVIKSVCEHRPISLGRMIQCEICGEILSSF